MPSKSDKDKSSRILEEVKKRGDTNEIVDVEEEKEKLVIFGLLGSFFAFNCAVVKEVLPLIKINYVPDAPGYILGVINVRGDIESVIDMQSLLEMPKQETTDQSRIMIVEEQGIRSGVLVGSLEDVIDVPKSSIIDPVSTLSDEIRDFVIGEIEYKGLNVTLLEAGRVFKKILDR